MLCLAPQVHHLMHTFGQNSAVHLSILILNTASKTGDAIFNLTHFMRWQMGGDMYAFCLQGRTEIACAMQSVHNLPLPRPLIPERKKNDELSPTDHA